MLHGKKLEHLKVRHVVICLKPLLTCSRRIDTRAGSSMYSPVKRSCTITGEYILRKCIKSSFMTPIAPGPAPDGTQLAQAIAVPGAALVRIPPVPPLLEKALPDDGCGAIPRR